MNGYLQNYKEVTEWKGISMEAVADLLAKTSLEAELTKGFFPFYSNTYYYIFVLLDWEIGTKINFTNEIVRFAKANSMRTFLDHGCGIGYDCIRLAKEADCDVHLMEIPSPHFDFAVWRMQKRGLGHKIKSLIHVTETDPMPALPMVDFISSIAVLEHVQDVEKVLRYLLKHTRYIALRPDPTMECKEHMQESMEFLTRVDKMHKPTLEALGISRVNATDPPIYMVNENAPPDQVMTWEERIDKNQCI